MRTKSKSRRSRKTRKMGGTLEDDLGHHLDKHDFDEHEDPRLLEKPHPFEFSDKIDPSLLPRKALVVPRLHGDTEEDTEPLYLHLRPYEKRPLRVPQITKRKHKVDEVFILPKPTPKPKLTRSQLYRIKEDARYEAYLAKHKNI